MNMFESIDSIGLVASGDRVAINKFICPNGHVFVEATNVGREFTAVCPWLECRAKGTSEFDEKPHMT
jgi:hypothetical protein